MAFSKGGGGTQSLPPDRPFLGNPITRWQIDTGKYPANSQTWWVYKRPIVLGTDMPPRQYLEVFDTDLRHQITVGNTPAPRGHYVYDAFLIDRATASEIPLLPIETSFGARPGVCAFFSGRVFFAGVQSAKYSTKIYFSQIIERDSQIGACHQQQDPTDEDAPDLLPSDGGVILIPEVVEVVNLVTKDNSLLVFSTNGVWQITGSEGLGFRANDYSTSKISDTPALSQMSFVSVDGTPMWWNRSGIWAVMADQMGKMSVQSLTDKTIKQFYLEIPAESKKFAKGAYNFQSKIVQWVYRTTAPTDVAEQFTYDQVLNFNTLTGAFYPWTPARPDLVAVKGLFAAEGDAVLQEIVPVYVGTNEVLVETEPVIIERRYRQAVDSLFKYIINIPELTQQIPYSEQP